VELIFTFSLCCLITIVVGAVILDVLQASAAAVLAILALIALATCEELLSSWFDILGANRAIHKTKVGLYHRVILIIDNSDGVL
jgi:hypothetical protein